MVPMPVPANKLFISLLARDKSLTLLCNSALTVINSSLIDCNSSLDVSSSSLVDCSSSLTDCISSLDDFNSSLEVSNSSLAAYKNSSFARSSSFKSAIRALMSLLLLASESETSTLDVPEPLLNRWVLASETSTLDVPEPLLNRWVLASSACDSFKITKYSGDSRLISGAGRLSACSRLASGPDVTGQMTRLTRVKWPFVLTRIFCTLTRSFADAARCRQVVNSARSPSRAIFKILLIPASPGVGSKNMPVRPCK